MNFDIHSMTNQIEHQTKAARVERQRTINDALGSDPQRPRVAQWAGTMLTRIGARLHGLPQAAANLPDVVTPESTQATA